MTDKIEASYSKTNQNLKISSSGYSANSVDIYQIFNNKFGYIEHIS